MKNTVFFAVLSVVCFISLGRTINVIDLTTAAKDIVMLSMSAGLTLGLTIYSGVTAAIYYRRKKKMAQIGRAIAEVLQNAVEDKKSEDNEDAHNN